VHRSDTTTHTYTPSPYKVPESVEVAWRTIQVLRTRVRATLRRFPVCEEFDSKHLVPAQDVQFPARGCTYYAVSFKRSDLVDFSENDLRRMAVRCELTNQKYIFGALARSAWVVVIADGGLKNRGKIAALPEGIPGSCEVHTFTKGGTAVMKVCETLASLVRSHRITLGCLRVSEAPPGSDEVTFEQACEHVENMSRREFESAMAAAEIAKSRKRCTPMQEVMNIVSTRLHRFLEGIWRANVCIFIDRPSDHTYIDFDQVPAEVKSKVGHRWDPVRKTFAEVRLVDMLMGVDALNSSVVLLGKPGVNKTSLIHTLAKTHCRLLGKDKYAVISNFDDVGSLSSKGVMNELGCLCADDADLVTANSRPLTNDEVKQVFEVRFSSGWGARYCPASVPAMLPKIFAANMEPPNTVAPAGRDSFAGRLPWLRYVVQGNAAAMEGLDVDSNAIARRITCFYFGDRIFGGAAYTAFEANDEAIMAERTARLHAFKQRMNM
jgi:hypothetical protein